jgi:hypothetical protein
MEKAGFIFNGFKAPNLLVNDDYKIEIFVLKCSGIYYNVVLYKKSFHLSRIQNESFCV